MTAATDWQTRGIDTRFGRLRVGVVFAVAAFWIVAPNLPSSAVRDELSPLWGPAVDSGLGQNWAVFSPNPRGLSIDVRARLEYDDGTTEYWDLPDFEPTIGAFRQYRWNKWQERVRQDDHDGYWQTTAEWIAAQNPRDGIEPMRVTLIRRWVDHTPLGEADIDADGWNQFEFFEWVRES